MTAAVVAACIWVLISAPAALAVGRAIRIADLRTPPRGAGDSPPSPRGAQPPPDAA